MPKTPWIVCADGTNPDHPQGFACLRCGTKRDITNQLPMDLDEYLAISKVFLKRHAHCKEKPTT